MRTEKITEAICVICGKKYPKWKKKYLSYPRGLTARKSNSKTCSSECSQKLVDISTKKFTKLNRKSKKTK